MDKADCAVWSVDMCLRLKSASINSVHLETQDTTLVGNRVITDAKVRPYWIWVGPKSNE
jgi:hypothetical protein